MPDRREHRGPHPEDVRLFAPEAWPLLDEAAADLRWLLSRGYPPNSALELVGNHYGLVARQRTAVARCTCSDAVAAGRKGREVGPDEVAGRPLWLDGYNVLTTIEAALSGGVVLLGCDGTYRDMASMHGSYRKVAETLPALELLGHVTAELQAQQCVWYLDRPVSNSGRLKRMIEEVADEHRWPWRVELVQDPDPLLAEAEHIVATADSVILDRCRAWYNLARETIVRRVPEATVVEIGGN